MLIRNKRETWGQTVSRFLSHCVPPNQQSIQLLIQVPQTAARLYGYLLLSENPVSLDRMVADLEISKSTASVAARLLEMYTLVHRSGQRGTRGVLFEASDDYSGMVNAQKRMLEQLAALIKEGAQSSSSKKTRERLRTMAEFYIVNRSAMESAQREWSSRK